MSVSIRRARFCAHALSLLRARARALHVCSSTLVYSPYGTPALVYPAVSAYVCLVRGCWKEGQGLGR